MPIVELARICHAASILVSIDGAHALGQIPLDIPSYVDVSTTFIDPLML
jgi:selenocysteine lyase/cysteine desulfurase